MSKYTPNYNIPQYESEDKPNLRDQYNSAMDVIDNQMKKEADDIVVAIATAQDAKKVADEAEAGVETLQPEVEKNTTDIAGLQTVVAEHTTDITEMKPKIEANTENIATNTENITKNTTDIANNKEETDTAIAGLTTEVNDNAGDIASAEADITTIQNTINGYGTAATKDFTNTLTTAQPNQLPTSNAINNYLFTTVGNWTQVQTGTKTFTGVTGNLSMTATLYINAAAKLACVYLKTNSGSITTSGATTAYSPTFFSMSETYRPTHNMEYTARAYLNEGIASGLDISGTGEVRAWASTSKAITNAGVGEFAVTWEYSQKI